MTRNIKDIRNEIIEEIASINSVEELEEIIRYMKINRLKNIHGNLFDGTRDSITVEELKKEQNFTGIDRAAFDKLVEEIDIQESIEELLAMLD